MIFQTSYKFYEIPNIHSPPPALRTMDVDYINIRMSGASLVAQTVKNLPAIQETQV